MRRLIQVPARLVPLLALALLCSAGATRAPANLEALKNAQVCAGRAEVQRRGVTDDALSRLAQDALTKLVAALRLSERYTDCPAWLSFQAQATNDANGPLVYTATLSLIAPGVQSRALQNLKGDAFAADRRFEFVTLWSQTGLDTAFDPDNLGFRLRAALVSQMADCSADWHLSH